MITKEGANGYSETHWKLHVPAEHCAPGLEVGIVAGERGITIGGGLIPWADIDAGRAELSALKGRQGEAVAEVVHCNEAFGSFHVLGMRALPAGAKLYTRPAQTEQHFDDRAVDRFAAAMKTKMAAARAKGRGGWFDRIKCPEKRLAGMLVKHLSKGNDGTFEDVANFCMMLHQRGVDPEVLAEAAEAPIKKARGEALELGVRALESKTSPQTAQTAPDDVVSAGIEFAAKHIEKKADNYAMEYGVEDMGGLSFGQGDHAQAKLDYHSSLIELAEELRALMAKGVV